MEWNAWLAENLVCPRDRLRLSYDSESLVCASAHRYPVFQGVPVLLVAESEPTHWVATQALEMADGRTAGGGVDGTPVNEHGIDPFVQEAVGATCGNMYRSLIGRCTDYPIPCLRVPPGRGELFLDVGCNWGRWCMASARAGYRPVGIDPSLPAVLAARRVAAQLGVSAAFVVADARSIPFREGIFDYVFSYSVLQHLDAKNVLQSLTETRRVLKSGGQSLIQMPNAWGLRSLYGQARRGFRRARLFEVRYWTLRQLVAAFSSAIGPTRLSVDGFFSLNVQPADARLLPYRYRGLIALSEALRKLSERIPSLVNVADSVYVTSVKPLVKP